MRIYDIIAKKRDGHPLTQEEIAFVVQGVTDGTLPDYQISALLMAIYFRGMNQQETAQLTQCMAHSGEMVDLSSIEGVKVDKHSTGGVGDKTTLVVAPLVASLGVKIAKMSGRGLGHTGGTVDKLEAIPGLQTALAHEQFFDIVRRHGIAVVGQSGNLAPADKKLYALRDVTATVGCMPLIASSIMSKKLAAGADAILLDVKTGSGAFMKTLEDATELSQSMVAIGEACGRRTAALITDMDIPLGRAIGNALEVAEAVETLQGRGPADLTEVCLALASNMLVLAGKGDLAHCRQLAETALHDGSGHAKLCEMVQAQGGNACFVQNPANFPPAAVCHEVLATQSGYITGMDTEACGIASVLLGAGRETKESAIDFSAGIHIHKKTGDYVQAGESLASFFTARAELLPEAERHYLAALRFAPQPPALRPLVLARVTAAGVELGLQE